MSWNMDRRIAIAGLGVAIVTMIGTWLAVPWLYKLSSKPSPDSQMNVHNQQEPFVSRPGEAHKQVSRKKGAQPTASEESEPSTAPKPPKVYPKTFQFFIGEWESVTPGNNWRMRVSWDSQSGQFLGYLTKQGKGSQDVGFRMGERVWTAEPIDDQTFVERQKYRGGLGTWWNVQKVDLRESSPDHLSGNVEFKRVE